MTPEAAIASLDRALAINGERVILRRTTGTQQIPLDVVVTANVSAKIGDAVAGRSPQEVIPRSGVVQSGAKVILSPTEMNRRQWPWPPKVNDKCIVDGKVHTVLAVEAIAMAGVLVRIEMQLKG